MSSDNGKGKGGKGKAKAEKPIQVSVIANATIFQLHNKVEEAKSRLSLAITVLKQQLNVPDSWDYQTDSRSFLPPKSSTVPAERAAAKPPSSDRISGSDPV